jgi:hypothetical protein
MKLLLKKIIFLCVFMSEKIYINSHALIMLSFTTCLVYEFFLIQHFYANQLYSFKMQILFYYYIFHSLTHFMLPSESSFNHFNLIFARGNIRHWLKNYCTQIGCGWQNGMAMDITTPAVVCKTI